MSKWLEPKIPRVRTVRVKESKSLQNQVGHQNIFTYPIVRAQKIEEMDLTADQGFSNSLLSPGGMVPLLLIRVFLGLLCFGVGVAPCLRSSTCRSWGPKCISCCPSVLTGSVFVVADQLGALLGQGRLLSYGVRPGFLCCFCHFLAT